MRRDTSFGISCIIRETIAARIIEAARNGEHDPERLYAVAQRQ
jgi:hypothetical protein